MNTAFIPQPLDAALAAEASIVKSASFAGTTFDFGSGFAPGGLGVPVGLVLKVESRSGPGTFTLTPVDSADDNTYGVAGPPITIPASGLISVGAFVSQRYARGSLTLSGSGTLTYSAWWNPLV